MEDKTFIVCYRLKRKNARRKEELRIKAETEGRAIQMFKSYVEMKLLSDRTYELVTGDWQPICFYKEGRCIGGSPEEGVGHG